MAESDQSKPVSNNNIVVILLVVAALAIGYLFNRVQMLEKNAGNTNTNTDQAANTTPGVQPTTAPTVVKVKKPSPTDDHWKGDKNARFVLIEYSDFECPFCRTNAETPAKLLAEVKNTAHVFRHFPLSFHANAQKEAEASECIAELGGNDAFWKFEKAIFERTTSNGTGFALDKLGPLAKEIGVNQVAFQKCLDDGKYEKKVKDQMAEGTTGGVAATPTTVIYDMKTDKQTAIEGAVPADQQKTTLEDFIKQNS